MNVLIIEDERALSDILLALLKQQKYHVDTVYDGITAEEYALSGIYDVIILDIMLPKKSGLEVLRSIREKGNTTPVLLLTAKSETQDKITGLDFGADDYLTKPFDTGELLARIRAVSRRRKADFISDEFVMCNTTLSKNTHKLSCKGTDVLLGMKEYQIMETLMQNSSQITPKERLIEKVWGFDSEAEYNTVEVYISFIRKKLLLIQADVQIKAIRGVGYSLEECG